MGNLLSDYESFLWVSLLWFERRLAGKCVFIQGHDVIGSISSLLGGVSGSWIGNPRREFVRNTRCLFNWTALVAKMVRFIGSRWITWFVNETGSQRVIS